MTRHLLYHILPVAGNGIWEWNLDQLIPRLPLFNGERVCAVVTQQRRIPYTSSARPRDLFRFPTLTVPAEQVIERLKPYGFKFVVQENDPNLGEVATFHALMSHVERYTRHTDYTLYAHAKGVTRFMKHPAIPWTRMLYESLMDYWPVVEGALSRACVAGSFLKWGMGWGAGADAMGNVIPGESESKWHFSGSWFWFRNAMLFNTPGWQRIDQFWAGIESYPSLHFDESQAGVVFHESGIEMNLANGEYMDKVLAEFEEWKTLNTANRTDLTPPAHWYPMI